jgi:cell division protein FtsN
MDFQRENQLKQHKQNLEKQHEQQQRLAPVRVQDTYNKENIEIQHKYNLEIFEKQAALTREMQKEQAKLLKKLSWRTVIATILAVIVGALFGLYLERSGLKQPLQSPPKQAITTIEKQNASAFPSLHEKEAIKATKPSAQEESSSKGSLKKP